MPPNSTARRIFRYTLDREIAGYFPDAIFIDILIRLALKGDLFEVGSIKKSADLIWLSRSAEPVSTEPTLIQKFTSAVLKSIPTVVISAP